MSLESTLRAKMVPKSADSSQGLALGQVSLYGSKSPDRWWLDFLTGNDSSLFNSAAGGKPITVLDAFSSVGGLSLGARIAGKLLGRPVTIGAAVDVDADALAVHASNHGTNLAHAGSVTDLVSWHPGRDRIAERRRFRSCRVLNHELLQQHRFDLLIGGPPCQGHSTLNNRTRGNDRKNELMVEMAAIAVALKIPTVVIENVPNALNDARQAIRWTTEYLQSDGYSVYPVLSEAPTSSERHRAVMRATDLGWPQTRKRIFIIATRQGDFKGYERVIQNVKLDPEVAGSVWWAIKGLQDEPRKYPDDVMRTTPELSPDNQRRMKYLFPNGPGRSGRFDLDDNSIRPRSHQDGHTYPAVYGRMHMDEPAPTITGGFMTPGRGRFIHPTRPRVLTPHEAARIQGFPDWFDFSAGLGRKPSRTELAKWIGDAVPSIMGAAAVMAALH